MSKKPSFRDLEQLSAYLDGELNESARQKLESRLARDPNLHTALDDISQTRALLRRTPQRRAPRNFTLSPQMVSTRPPMPRLVPVLNYASVVAMLIFAFTFLSPFGLGGGAMPEAPMMESVAMEMPAEEPAAEEPAAPMLMDAAEEPPAEGVMAEPEEDYATEEEAPAEESAAAAEMAEETPTVSGPAANLPSTEEPDNAAAGESERAEATQEPELAAAEPAEEGAPAAEKSLTQTNVQTPTLIPPTAIPTTPPQFGSLLAPFQWILLIVALLSPLVAWFLRLATVARWKNVKE
jgi:anti-sigma factor RsiW